MAPPLLVVTPTKGHVGWDRASTRFGGVPASQWQEPEGQPFDRTRVTGIYKNESKIVHRAKTRPARRERICRTRILAQLNGSTSGNLQRLRDKAGDHCSGNRTDTELAHPCVVR